MHRTTKRAAKITALAATAFIASTAVANASVTIDAAGKGFVGKGDVQTALGLNNSALQKAVDAKSLVFTAEQPTSQSLNQSVSQSGTQVGTQTGTQSGTQTGTQSGTRIVSQDLTCEFTNGSGTKTFHRDGVRDGERTGTREGTRTGSREGVRDGDREGTRSGTQAGTQTGSLAYDLDVEARKSNQYTGFILKGWKGTPSYTETGAPSWNAPAYGDWSFGDWSFDGWSFGGDYQFDGAYTFGDYTFEDVAGVEWGEWNALPGENPDDCLRSQNADKITQISNVLTYGDPTNITVIDGEVTPGVIAPGAVTPGQVKYSGNVEGDGAIEYGPVVAGAYKLFVSLNGGVAKAL
jgi:hypothetical protein